MPMQTKVLLVSLHHPELMRGGAQQVCYELFQELRQRSDVRVCLLASTDQSTPGLFKSGARITGFDGREDEFLFLSRDYNHWWHKLGEPLLIEAYVEFLGMVRPDVVHFHHFMTFGIDLITVTRRTLLTAASSSRFMNSWRFARPMATWYGGPTSPSVSKQARFAAINVFRSVGLKSSCYAKCGSCSTSATWIALPVRVNSWSGTT